MQIVHLIGSIVALIGSIFLFLGALGVLRMPDLYNRMQAGTKATTLGSILTLFGIGLYHLDWLPQMIILILFIAVTNPLSSHALARAAHFAGIPMTKDSVHDQMNDDNIPKAEEIETADKQLMEEPQ